MRSLRLLATGVAVVAALAGCGGDDDDGDDASPGTTAATVTTTAPAETTTTAGDAEPDAPVTVAAGETSLGATLVDAQGRTLYVFDNDSQLSSACVDACAQAWPPVVVEGDPVVGEGLDADAFETFARADGSMQLAVGGMPLYRFSGDQAAGDVNGQGVGDVWWAVGPDGQKIGAQEASTGGLGY
jgi:predicted lipoprotein with Yx(FWY)xxD motif